MQIKYVVIDIYMNKIVSRHFTLEKARKKAKDYAYKKGDMLHIFKVQERILPSK